MTQVRIEKVAALRICVWCNTLVYGMVWYVWYGVYGVWWHKELLTERTMDMVANMREKQVCLHSQRLPTPNAVFSCFVLPIRII